MSVIYYKTGRNYGTEQVLSIRRDFLDPNNDRLTFEQFSVEFQDQARLISGRVKVFGRDLQVPGMIGPAVLREYDAGRYTPL